MLLFQFTANEQQTLIHQSTLPPLKLNGCLQYTPCHVLLTHENTCHTGYTSARPPCTEHAYQLTLTCTHVNTCNEAYISTRAHTSAATTYIYRRAYSSAQAPLPYHKQAFAHQCMIWARYLQCLDAITCGCSAVLCSFGNVPQHCNTFIRNMSSIDHQRRLGRRHCRRRSRLYGCRR